MASAADAAGLCSLWAAAGLGRGEAVDRAEITERLRRDPWIFLVAEDSGTIVGSVMACYDGHRGWLKRVAVRPDRQGTGLGRALVEEAESRLLRSGISQLRLAVEAANTAALGFWAHLGYQRCDDIAYHQRDLDDSDASFATMRPWPTTWSADWPSRVAGQGCSMCSSLGGEHPSSLLVARGEVADVRLDRHSRFRGYCVAIWNQGHAVDPSDLEPVQAARYWAEVTRLGRALQEVFRPLKLNYLTLGNTVPHLHTHVVPRYPDDPAAGGPIPWELVRAEGPAEEIELERQAEAIRTALAGQPAG